MMHAVLRQDSPDSIPGYTESTVRRRIDQLEILGHLILSQLNQAQEYLQYAESSEFSLVDNPTVLGKVGTRFMIIRQSAAPIPHLYGGVVLIVTDSPVHIRNLHCEHLIILGSKQVVLGQGTIKGNLTVMGVDSLSLGTLTIEGSMVCITNELILERTVLKACTHWYCIANQLMANAPEFPVKSMGILALRRLKRSLYVRCTEFLRTYEHVTLLDSQIQPVQRMFRMHLPTIHTKLLQFEGYIPEANPWLESWRMSSLFGTGRVAQYCIPEIVTQLTKELPYLQAYNLLQKQIQYGTGTVWDLLPDEK